MIPVVLKGLREHGLLRAGPDPDVHITLTQGDAIHVRVYQSSRLIYFLKCSKFNSLLDEYERHLQAHELLGETVAPPRALFKAGEWNVIASAGISAMPLRQASLVGPSADRDVVAAIVASFARQGRLADPAHADTRADRLEQVLSETLERPALAGVRQRVQAPQVWEVVRALPNIPQHGDFVLSNLAWARTRLIVFDYEDFGRIQLPGFDMATLYLSLFEFEADAVRRFLSADEAQLDALVPWLRPSCANLGLTFDTMRRLLPVYLTAFVSLKRNYGPAVRHIAERALLALDAARDG